MQGQLLYEGKAKKIYSTNEPNILLMEFKDSLTAFNALKKGQFNGKGALNCQISTLIFKELTKNKIAHHWLITENNNFMRVQKTNIIPLEVVVRNTMAGSLAKKLNLTEGETLKNPIVEYYYKNDALNDPFVNNEQIMVMNWATEVQLHFIREQALKINQILLSLFSKIQIRLVDFKLEFGVNSEEQVILSDEISPDCMRLWDAHTQKKLDKDRFRQDLGEVNEAYQEVFDRLTKGVQS